MADAETEAKDLETEKDEAWNAAQVAEAGKEEVDKKIWFLMIFWQNSRQNHVFWSKFQNFVPKILIFDLD